MLRPKRRKRATWSSEQGNQVRGLRTAIQRANELGFFAVHRVLFNDLSVNRLELGIDIEDLEHKRQFVRKEQVSRLETPTKKDFSELEKTERGIKEQLKWENTTQGLEAPWERGFPVR